MNMRIETTAGIMMVVSLLVSPTTALASEHWSARSVTDPVTGLSSCKLMPPPVVIDDGHGDTKITVLLDRESLLVLTDSNIDSAMNDLSLSVDDGEPYAVDEVVLSKHVLFRSRVAEIIEQFIAGSNMSINLRFWPSWPTTGIKTATFSLIGFTKAYNSFACE